MGEKLTAAERVQAVAESIVNAFKTGELPKALAQLFLDVCPEDSPTRTWSWRNRLVVALRGEKDARGFRQWKRVGRSVKRGERAFHILGPIQRKIEEIDEATGETQESHIVTGFVTIPVFGYSQTEGEPLAIDAREAELLETLPLLEVARAWGLEVTTTPFGIPLGFLGRYSPGQRITLAVENLSTWAHELVHAAEDRLGLLLESSKAEREVVAELGGAVLLECLGEESASDRGGAWEYIERQAKTPKEALRLCTSLLDRTCAAVSLILETARKLEVSCQPAFGTHPSPVPFGAPTLPGIAAPAS